MLVMLVCSVASADTITFQNGVGGYSGLVDGSARSESGREKYNFGAYSQVNVGWEAAGQELVGFVDFTNSINQIAAGQTITSAKLGMYLVSAEDQNSVGDRTISAFAMLKSLNMGTKVASDAAAGEVCWYELARHQTKWGNDTSNAGPVSGMDYTTTYGGSLVINPSQNGSYVEFDVTSIVNAWYTGALTNRGFLLREVDEVNRTRVNFGSSEGSSTPYLTVTYTPEPATMSLLLLGGAALLKRRSA
ncbi:MAG: DNRLRE domain-containing protein [Phycisphaerae bacterium]|nr:DNRLRE domain-containing protein [Phycisphaerae bacterium]